MKNKNKDKYKNILKIRYKILRELGLSPKEAAKYRGRSLDVSKITIIEEEVKDKKGNVKIVKKINKDDAYYDVIAEASENIFKNGVVKT